MFQKGVLHEYLHLKERGFKNIKSYIKLGNRKFTTLFLFLKSKKKKDLRTNILQYNKRKSCSPNVPLRWKDKNKYMLQKYNL